MNPTPSSLPTRFSSLADLARLPWFTALEDRVVVSDDSIGPIVDVHGHVALAYVRPMQLDLNREWPRTEYYLPSCCAVDLLPYVNRNFPPAELAAMKKDLVGNAMNDRGMRRTHTVPNLVKEMDELGIVRTCLLPIDFPVFSENARHAVDAGKKDPRILAFGSVHPYAKDPKGKLAEQAHGGIHGVKVHPNIQMIRPDAARAMDLYRYCADANLPVLWHCGPVGIEPALGRYLTQVKWYEKPIAENPKTTFILGHSGALQYKAALDLMNRYPNVYCETSSLGLVAIREFIERGDPDRMLFGSDWPFYHQAIPLAKVLIATEDRKDVRAKILRDNALKLLRIEV
jgi:hypothetical protein